MNPDLSTSAKVDDSTTRNGVPDTTDRTLFSKTRRHFTSPGEDVYDAFEWERRDARLLNYQDNTVAFEQTDVEFPATWSQTATNIVAQKYFRGALGTAARETSLKQVIDRVVNQITAWGADAGYFADEDEQEAFRAELKYILVSQRASFNSPVWFNIGVPNARQQAAACFILDVEDNLASILNWYTEEGRIFQGGSGSGANLSKIRSSKEQLSRGGVPSGPVSFMRGADASAGTIKSGGTTRRAAKMVILDIDHPDVDEFIWCKAKEERKARVLRDAGFDVGIDGEDAHSLQYQNANNSVRLTDEFMQAVENDESWGLISRTSGEVIEEVPARELFDGIAQASWECADPGVQFDTTINKWNTTPNAGRIEASNPCSEHLRLANSACNLASINLLPYVSDDGRFNTADFLQTVSVLVTAQDILVGATEYPTPAIAAMTATSRDIGLGYTNLGASLMALGLAYDSEQGRDWAAAITAMLTGAAANRSVAIAERHGPAPLYDTNAAEWQHVYDLHRDAAHVLQRSVREVVDSAIPVETNGAPHGELPPVVANSLIQLADTASELWDTAREGIAKHGARNAELTVAAPTGTISFMMDADTTGIEPDLGLVKYKKLVGGGSLRIVNQTVPRALHMLGYDPLQIVEICEYLDERGSMIGAPHLAPEHLQVFACSIGELQIRPDGHLKMMAAIQPFFSGAMSKTINLAEETTAEEVADLLMDSWKMGIKCVAIYRDNCKVSQPMSTKKDDEKSKSDGATPEVVIERAPARERLPQIRTSRTFEFKVADLKGFATVGEYPDGRPGELFVRVAKQGSTLAGIMDALAISVSHGLQYGVPMRAYVHAFVGMRFEPAGMTSDPEVSIARSVIDYLFRRLALEYLDPEERIAMGIMSRDEQRAELNGEPVLRQPSTNTAEATTSVGSSTSSAAAASLDDDVDLRDSAPMVVPGTEQARSDAPLCMSCGTQMVRAGSCFTCTECGATSGCS